MTDIVSPVVRSRMMAAVKSRNTAPEVSVRRALHAAGYRFRLHPLELAGKPDLILPRHRIAVFVHGCFWHGHACPKGRRPTSNVAFWDAKLGRNVERDADVVSQLERKGLRVVTIWECSLAEGVAALIELLHIERASRSVGAEL